MAKKKHKIKRIFIGICKCLTLSVLVAVIAVGVVWSNRVAAARVCTGMKVNVEMCDSLQFVTPENILADIKKSGLTADGVRLADYDTYKLQNTLSSRDYIENASCVILTDGTILVNVKQMVPVMRIFNLSQDSYYYNIAGKRIRASSKFRMDVPIVFGVNENDTLLVRDCLKLSDYISSHPDISDYVTSIDAHDPNNVIIVPNIRGHVVNFGSISHGNFDNKFAKIKQMYKEVIPHCGWWMYDTISVKWKNQIVATRRNPKKEIQPDFSADDDELPPDIGSVTVSENYSGRSDVENNNMKTN